MKPRLTLLIAGMLGIVAPIQAQSPITLDASDYVLPLGADTVDQPLGNTAFSILANFATNATWDFSGSVYENLPFVYGRQAPATPNPFVGSDFYAFRYYMFDNKDYLVNRYFSLLQTSLSVPGEAVSLRQAFSIGATTGVATDSVILPVQKISYSVPEQVIKFPALFSTNWSSISNYTTEFRITASAFGLNNALLERRSQRIRTDALLGGGTVRLRNKTNTGTTVPIQVAQVSSNQTVRDSFYLNGVPALSGFLSSFGQQQGQRDTTSRTFLYRKGETTPLVEAIWKGLNRSGAPMLVNIHRQRLPVPASIGNLPAETAFLISPNPVRRGQVLNFTTVSGNWKATVVNAMGQILAIQNGMGTGTSQVLELPATLPAGTYFLQLQSGGKSLPAQQFIVID